MNEFIVESKGHCFLCLKQISLDLSSQTGNNSIQYLARYLDLDMRKVFNKYVQEIDPELVQKVQRAKLKVELCQVCTIMNDSFSSAYRQLEKIKLEVKLKLDMIHQRMLLTGGTHIENNHQLSKLLAGPCDATGVDGELSAKLEITDVLRNEAIDNCSLKLSTAKPRVKIQKLTSNELIQFKEAKSKFELKQLSLGNLEMDPRIKRETIPSNIDTTSEPDDDNSFTGYGKEELEYELTHQIKTKVKGKPHARHQCDQCDKSFPTTSNLKRHKLAIHIGQNFGCDKCDKKFGQLHSLKRHQLVIHIGKRFCCAVTNVVKHLLKKIN